MSEEAKMLEASIYLKTLHQETGIDFLVVMAKPEGDKLYMHSTYSKMAREVGGAICRVLVSFPHIREDILKALTLQSVEGDLPLISQTDYSRAN